MKPIKFPEVNVTFAEDQPEYQPLPAFKDKEGVVTTCWSLTWRERLRLLITGKLWVQVLTFNRGLQPMSISTQKEDVITTKPKEANSQG